MSAAIIDNWLNGWPIERSISSQNIISSVFIRASVWSNIAFQVNAFQNNAFQTSNTATGGFERTFATTVSLSSVFARAFAYFRSMIGNLNISSTFARMKISIRSFIGNSSISSSFSRYYNGIRSFINNAVSLSSALSWNSIKERMIAVAISLSSSFSRMGIFIRSFMPTPYALSFDGINSGVNIEDHITLKPTYITIEGWVTLKSGGNNHFDSSPCTKGWMKFDCGFENSATPRAAFRVLFQGDAGWTELIGIGTQPLNTWIFVAYVYDGSYMRIYVNGVQNNYVAKVGTISWSTANIMIGGNDYGGSDYSIVDDVHVWNRALSATEIQASFQASPDFSSQLLAKIPKGTTQVITTISWQGLGSINATITTPSQTYTEDMIPAYQKTTYSTSGGTQNMLNMKRSSISVGSLSTDQSWSITLRFDIVVDYQITVEIQK